MFLIAHQDDCWIATGEMPAEMRELNPDKQEHIHYGPPRCTCKSVAVKLVARGTTYDILTY